LDLGVCFGTQSAIYDGVQYKSDPKINPFSPEAAVLISTMAVGTHSRRASIAAHNTGRWRVLTGFPLRELEPEKATSNFIKYLKYLKKRDVGRDCKSHQALAKRYGKL